MLKTRSIFLDREESDGLIISVMSRHTLDDGITIHPDITNQCYDYRQKSLAPSDKLVGDYYKRGLKEDFGEFEKRYLEEIRKPKIADEVRTLARYALDHVVTLVCREDTPDKCHRRLLAEECKRYEPRLVLDIK